MSRDESSFLLECRLALRVIPRSSDLSRPRRVFYRELVEAVAKDPLRGWLGLSADEFHSFWSWAPASDYLINPEFSLNWQMIRNRLSLNDKAFIRGLADLQNCNRCELGLEETASHAFYHCPRVHPLWDIVSELTARIASEKLVPIDRAYASDNGSPGTLG
ncbi:unnamed protein product [Acanthosepion pharaonis]|uniref:Reverse transcriptase zinc-binding domain-containing protein n=1 Tax=Acanthosepion pharaonis TaxID=158019 RepID=A0A812EJJ3_ACAPH|nr:unnamed protein product [Sepia pharaonis]